MHQYQAPKGTFLADNSDALETIYESTYSQCYDATSYGTLLFQKIPVTHPIP